MTITLNDINKQIKSVKNIDIKLAISPEFEQAVNIPKRVGNYEKPEEMPKNKENKRKYNPGDIIELPSCLTDICNLDNYYIYCVSEKNCLIESIFYNIDANFKLENEATKTVILNEFKELLKTHIGNKKLLSEKNRLSKLIDNNVYNNEYIEFCADYFKINILCVDVDNNNYNIAKELSGNDKNIIIVKQDNIYMPMLHMFGELPNYSLCSMIVSKFNDK